MLFPIAVKEAIEVARGPHKDLRRPLFPQGNRQRGRLVEVDRQIAPVVVSLHLLDNAH